MAVTSRWLRSNRPPLPVPSPHDHPLLDGEGDGDELLLLVGREVNCRTTAPIPRARVKFFWAQQSVLLHDLPKLSKQQHQALPPQDKTVYVAWTGAPATYGLAVPQYCGQAGSSPVGSVHPSAQKVLLSDRCVAKQTPVAKQASCLLSSQQEAWEPVWPVALGLHGVPELFWPLMA